MHALSNAANESKIENGTCLCIFSLKINGFAISNQFGYIALLVTRCSAEYYRKIFYLYVQFNAIHFSFDDLYSAGSVRRMFY